MNYVIVDIETNGVTPDRDDLLLVSATKIQNGEIISVFSKLVKPLRPQTDELELFTGITNAELNDADNFVSVIEEFKAFCDDSTVVCYDEFEYSFLSGKGFYSDNVIYLREYIKRIYPDLKSFIADAVIVSLGLEEQLKAYVSNCLYYGKSRLFYSLKVAIIFLAVIENFNDE